MSLGAALDVVIGLSFTYLLLGVLASGAQELVATWLSKRAKDLRKGIGRLLADSNGKPVTDLFNKVVGHGLIEDLSPKKLPSYVPARNFSLALLEALKDGSQAPLFSQVENTIAKLPPGTARESLTALVTHAAGDLDALRSGIEIWFDDAMDRLSGAYKRFSQYFTLSFGIAVAIAFNVDSITLAKTLWTDPAARQAAGAAAQRYIDTHQDATADDIRAQMQAAKDEMEALPVGWGKDATLETAWTRITHPLRSDIWRIVGWIITGLAVSLGAPFWFDTLKDLLGLRNTGPKPARAAEASTNGKVSS